jgi:hypothetical protein
MPPTLALWIAFTTSGAMFALVMLLGADVLAAPGSGSGAQFSPASSAAPDSGHVGTIEVHAFDLGFQPAMVHVAEPGLHAEGPDGMFGMVTALIVEEQP